MQDMYFGEEFTGRDMTDMFRRPRFSQLSAGESLRQPVSSILFKKILSLSCPPVHLCDTGVRIAL